MYLQQGKNTAYLRNQTAKRDIEDYGFFVEPAEIKSSVENDQGYGFFGEVGNQGQRPEGASSGRRHEDIPAAALPTGCRRQ